MRNVQSTLLYRWFNEVWNRDDKNAIDALLTDSSKVHGLVGNAPAEGTAGFKAFYDNFKSQFHNIQIEVEDSISEDDVQAARTTVNATHTSTNKNVRFTGICMVRIENGKIAEAWNNYDFLGMYQQLGQNLTA
jgi:predicted ester cyclase